MDRPGTPHPPEIVLEDPGPPFESWPPQDQADVLQALGTVREVCLALATTLSRVEQVNRAARIGLRRRIESLPDGAVVPFRGKATEGQPLTREAWLDVLDRLDEAERTQFTQEDQDRFGRIVGPTRF